MRNIDDQTADRSDRELGSVANALRLLEVMAWQPDAGVSELARSLQLSKSSVDRLLTTFVRAGFARRDQATRRYSLTVKLVGLAEGVRRRLSIGDIARPHLARLAEAARETVNLSVYSAGSLVYVEVIPSTHTFQIELRAGTVLPAYCTAAGKAILAFSPASDVEAYLAALVAVPYTAATLTTPAELRAELHQIRALGYAIDRGEMLAEAWCAAAPVLDSGRRPMAAVSVTSPRSRFTANQDELTGLVATTAAAIAREVAAPAGTA